MAATRRRFLKEQAGVDLDALTETIQRVSQLVVENPEIRELDVNPIFAFEEGDPAIADAYREHGYLLKEMAEFLGVHYSTVSRRLRRHQAAVG